MVFYEGFPIKWEYLDEFKVNLKYEIPLAEIMFDFYDKLKSRAVLGARKILILHKFRNKFRQTWSVKR